MNDTRYRGLRHFTGLAVLVALTAGTGSAWAGPPTALAPATVAAGESYQACLLADLGKQAGPALPRAVAEAAVACGSEEAALSAAVLKENPDRPLFARSYAQTLKDAVVAQVAPVSARSSPSMLVAQRSRP